MPLPDPGFHGNFVETSLLTRAREQVAALLTLHCIGVFYGNAGRGKTVALIDAAGKAAATHRVVYVEVPQTGTAKEVEVRILSEMTQTDYSDESEASVRRRLTDKLSNGPSTFLMVDEIQRGQLTIFENLRDFHTAARPKLALLLAGGNSAWETIQRFPMLRSRVSLSLEFTPLSESEFLSYMPEYNSMYEGVDPELLKLLFAHLGGSWRNVGNFTQLARFKLDQFGSMDEKKLPDEARAAVQRLKEKRKLTPDLMNAVLILMGDAGDLKTSRRARGR